jgi:NTE family protein
MRAAIIFAGAVAKGAFEAGVLDVLTTHPEIEIVRLVGTSSGALNATMMAHGVHRGNPREAATRLVELWTRSADLLGTFHFSPRAILARQGISDQKQLRRLLAANITPCASPGSERSDLLHIVVAALGGVDGKIVEQGDATTHELVNTFGSRDFGEQAGLERIFDAATASSAFPIVFAPAWVGGYASVDGGAVNNTGIKYALSSKDVDTVIVIAPTVQKLAADPPPRSGLATRLSGRKLLERFTDVLINERLYRDLREAVEVNTMLAKLHQLDAETRDRALQALGWQDRTQIRIIPIRPREPLPGTSFSGFFHQRTREDYIDRGRRRAYEVLNSSAAAHERVEAE